MCLCAKEQPNPLGSRAKHSRHAQPWLYVTAPRLGTHGRDRQAKPHCCLLSNHLEDHTSRACDPHRSTRCRPTGSSGRSLTLSREQWSSRPTREPGVCRTVLRGHGLGSTPKADPAGIIRPTRERIAVETHASCSGSSRGIRHRGGSSCVSECRSTRWVPAKVTCETL